jgi:hypothetical protein
MKTIGRFIFPETLEEARRWLSSETFYPLSSRVLAVAHTRAEGAWCAYCDAVAGEDHTEEYKEVFRSGDKLPARVAQELFPEFEGIPYAE